MTAVELATFRAKPHHGDAMAAGLPAEYLEALVGFAHYNAL